jgi:hypothetical protein
LPQLSSQRRPKPPVAPEPEFGRPAVNEENVSWGGGPKPVLPTTQVDTLPTSPPHARFLEGCSEVRPGREGGGEWESGGGRGGLNHSAARARTDCTVLDATDRLQKAVQSEAKPPIALVPGFVAKSPTPKLHQDKVATGGPSCTTESLFGQPEPFRINPLPSFSPPNRRPVTPLGVSLLGKIEEARELRGRAELSSVVLPTFGRPEGSEVGTAWKGGEGREAIGTREFCVTQGPSAKDQHLLQTAKALRKCAERHRGLLDQLANIGQLCEQVNERQDLELHRAIQSLRTEALPNRTRAVYPRAPAGSGQGMGSIQSFGSKRDRNAPTPK